MQYNNPNGKWLENIPFMVINLEHDRDIYLGKDTIVAYAREEDKACDYLEINEIIELTDLRNKTPTEGKSIVESDLSVFSSSGYRTPLCRAEGSTNIPRNQREVQGTQG